MGGEAQDCLSTCARLTSFDVGNCGTENLFSFTDKLYMTAGHGKRIGFLSGSLALNNVYVT